ncbi:hypothetical protein P7C73_g3791, partial [Tremellales sp. Uapishka_1]
MKDSAATYLVVFTVFLQIIFFLPLACLVVTSCLWGKVKQDARRLNARLRPKVRQQEPAAISTEVVAAELGSPTPSSPPRQHVPHSTPLIAASQPDSHTPTFQPALLHLSLRVPQPPRLFPPLGWQYGLPLPPPSQLRLTPRLDTSLLPLTPLRPVFPAKVFARIGGHLKCLRAEATLAALAFTSHDSFQTLTPILYGSIEISEKACDSLFRGLALSRHPITLPVPASSDPALFFHPPASLEDPSENEFPAVLNWPAVAAPTEAEEREMYQAHKRDPAPVYPTQESHIRKRNLLRHVRAVTITSLPTLQASFQFYGLNRFAHYSDCVMDCVEQVIVKRGVVEAVADWRNRYVGSTHPFWYGLWHVLSPKDICVELGDNLDMESFIDTRLGIWENERGIGREARDRRAIWLKLYWRQINLRVLELVFPTRSDASWISVRHFTIHNVREHYIPPLNQTALTRVFFASVPQANPRVISTIRSVLAVGELSQPPRKKRVHYSAAEAQAYSPVPGPFSPPPTASPPPKVRRVTPFESHRWEFVNAEAGLPDQEGLSNDAESKRQRLRADVFRQRGARYVNAPLTLAPRVKFSPWEEAEMCVCCGRK